MLCFAPGSVPDAAGHCSSVLGPLNYVPASGIHVNALPVLLIMGFFVVSPGPLDPYVQHLLHDLLDQLCLCVLSFFRWALYVYILVAKEAP